MENDKLSVQSIRSLLNGNDYNICVYDTVDSTNTLLKENALSMPDKTVIVAHHQTAGRGRMGRVFHSPINGIYFSILLKPHNISADETIMFTIIAAVAVSKSIEEVTGKVAGIKWVNDIFMNNRKVCGILTEGSIKGDGLMEYAVVGIGINVSEPETGFDSSIKDVAGAVLSSSDSISSAKDKLVASTLKHFFSYYENFSKRDYIVEYRKRLFILGKRIYILENGHQIPAIATDIDGSCHLMVKTDDGHTRTLSFGEVSVRPI